MPDERRIREVVEEALESQRSPEELCAAEPELLDHVRRRLALARRLSAEIDEVFPPPRSHAARSLTTDEVLPQIPGHDVRAILGRGGVGVVYRAHHLELDRDVAVKMLLSGAFATPRERARFRLEAQAVANLRHPNIVHVHEFGDVDGRPYFTMELVEGGSLAQKLDGKPLRARAAAELVSVLAGAIETAHASGIVHRDLKPGNVMLTADGTPKIADFGLARRLTDASSLTASGVTLGTPSYMAPEQVQGDGAAIGPATDVYALGAILYETLTGRPPFRAATALATQREVVEREPVRPSRIDSAIARDLEIICLTCLQKEPARRYQSAGSLAADLGRFLRGESISARRTSRGERVLRWVRRNPGRTALTATALVLCVLVAVAGARELARADRQRKELAEWSPLLDEVARLQTTGSFDEARAVLQRLPPVTSTTLGSRIADARAELELVERLDAVRLDRAALIDGRFDLPLNRRRADERYATLFREAGLGGVEEDSALVAERIRASPLGAAFVAALDDWAVCAHGLAHEAWLLEVARIADTSTDDWRRSVRDPALCGDPRRLVELTRAAPIESQSVQLLVAMGERLVTVGRDPIEFLKRVQLRHPDDFWANFSLGDALSKDRPAEALRYYQAALGLRPDAAVAHSSVGRVLAHTHRMEEAEASFRRALELDPNFTHALANLALALTVMGRAAEAVAFAQRSIELEPDSARNHNNLADALEKLGRDDEAVESLERALALDPDYIYSHHLLGHITRRRGDFERTAFHFASAIRIAPTEPHAYYLFGDVLLHQGRVDEAAAQFEAAIDIAPTWPWGHFGLANCHEARGGDDDAIASHRRAEDLRRAQGGDAAQLEQELTHIRRRLAAILRRTGRLDEWRVAWRGEFADRNASHEVLDGYAELCLFLGRMDDYRDACTELLERFGASADALVCERTGRACLLAPLPAEMVARAAQLIERARAADMAQLPEWAPRYFALAQSLVFLRRGEPAAALELLQGEVLDTFAPLPQLVRCLALHASGDPRAARRELVAAVAAFDWANAAMDNRDHWMVVILRRECEGVLGADVARVLAADRDAQGVEDVLSLIDTCRALARHAEAARLYVVLFELAPESASDAVYAHRYYAAQSAALGAVASTRVADERAQMRTLALGWLTDDLAAKAEVFDGPSSPARDALPGQLDHWLVDPGLAAVRDTAALAELPDDERARFAELWRAVEALRTRAHAAVGR